MNAEQMYQNVSDSQARLEKATAWLDFFERAGRRSSETIKGIMTNARSIKTTPKCRFALWEAQLQAALQAEAIEKWAGERGWKFRFKKLVRVPFIGTDAEFRQIKSLRNGMQRTMVAPIVIHAGLPDQVTRDALARLYATLDAQRSSHSVEKLEQMIAKLQAQLDVARQLTDLTNMMGTKGWYAFDVSAEVDNSVDHPFVGTAAEHKLLLRTVADKKTTNRVRGRA